MKTRKTYSSTFEPECTETERDFYQGKLMKTVSILLAAAFAVALPAASQTPPPRIFFTDITSGPATGGENGAGAYVTIYGNFFGTSPGTVTIGGVKATTYKQWGTPWL